MKRRTPRMLTTIERKGQGYVDELVTVGPKPESPCEAAVRAVFGRPLPRPLVVGFNRRPLRWMTRDKQGRIVPNKSRGKRT